MACDGADVLLLDAHMRQMLTAARSLGSAGLRVAMAESYAECDATRPPPSFSSRWVSSTSTLPNHLNRPDAYAQAVVQHVSRHPTRVVIPGGDAAIAALRPWRRQLESHTTLALASEAALDVATDKARTLALAEAHGVCTPRTLPITDRRATAKVLRAIGYPAVIKPTMPFIPESRARGRVRPQAVLTERDGELLVEQLLDRGAEVLAQEYVGGRRETVSFFLVDGRVQAEFAQWEQRMTPVLGGVSVMRESISMPPDLRMAAVELVRSIGLDGYSEIEFRRDAAGTPRLMEVNVRLSGSVEVPRRAGVDFPLMLWKWAVGEPVPESSGYRAGVRLRWLRGDVNWLRENFARRGHPGGLPPLEALREFSSDFLRGTHYDYVDWRDLAPARVELSSAVATATQKLGQVLRPVRT